MNTFYVFLLHEYPSKSYQHIRTYQDTKVPEEEPFEYLTQTAPTWVKSSARFRGSEALGVTNLRIYAVRWSRGAQIA